MSLFKTESNSIHKKAIWHFIKPKSAQIQEDPCMDKGVSERERSYFI